MTNVAEKPVRRGPELPPLFHKAAQFFVKNPAFRSADASVPFLVKCLGPVFFAHHFPEQFKIPAVKFRVFNSVAFRSPARLFSLPEQKHFRACEFALPHQKVGDF